MEVLVRWKEHDRQYTMGIQTFLKKLNIQIPDSQIQETIKKLLEQQEMTNAE